VSQRDLRLWRLEATDACRTLIADYAWYVDVGTGPLTAADHLAARPRRIAELFTADGIWESSTLGRYDGRAAITERFARPARDGTAPRFSVHHYATPAVRLDDDDPHIAVGRGHLLFSVVAADGTATTGAGLVEAVFGVECDRWRIRRLTTWVGEALR
jgi:hypothetical protein